MNFKTRLETIERIQTILETELKSQKKIKYFVDLEGTFGGLKARCLVAVQKYLKNATCGSESGETQQLWLEKVLDYNLDLETL